MANIKLTNEEVWLISSINTNVQSAQQELQRLMAARASLTQLLENKYNAVFNPKTGLLEPKPKEKSKKVKEA